MTKKKISIAIFFLTIILSSSIAFAEQADIEWKVLGVPRNVIVNGDFNRGTFEGWAVGGDTMPTLEPTSEYGIAHLKVSPPQDTSDPRISWMQQTFKAEKGMQLSYSYLVQGGSTWPGTSLMISGLTVSLIADGQEVYYKEYTSPYYNREQIDLSAYAGKYVTVIFTARTVPVIGSTVDALVFMVSTGGDVTCTAAILCRGNEVNITVDNVQYKDFGQSFKKTYDVGSQSFFSVPKVLTVGGKTYALDKWVQGYKHNDLSPGKGETSASFGNAGDAYSRFFYSNGNYSMNVYARSGTYFGSTRPGQDPGYLWLGSSAFGKKCFNSIAPTSKLTFDYKIEMPTYQNCVGDINNNRCSGSAIVQLKIGETVKENLVNFAVSNSNSERIRTGSVSKDLSAYKGQDLCVESSVSAQGGFVGISPFNADSTVRDPNNFLSVNFSVNNISTNYASPLEVTSPYTVTTDPVFIANYSEGLTGFGSGDLNVFNCNANNICEYSAAETQDSCPADCRTTASLAPSANLRPNQQVTVKIAFNDSRFNFTKEQTRSVQFGIKIDPRTANEKVWTGCLDTKMDVTNSDGTQKTSQVNCNSVNPTCTATSANGYFEITATCKVPSAVLAGEHTLEATPTIFSEPIQLKPAQITVVIGDVSAWFSYVVKTILSVFGI